MEKDKDLENNTIMEMKIFIMWEIGIMIKEMDKDQILNFKMDNIMEVGKMVKCKDQVN